MNIVLVNQYAGSPRHGMEFRPHQLAKHWVASGHDVTIIAGSFSHLRNLNPTVGRKVEEEWIDGIRYRWVPTPRYSGNGMGRIRSIVSFLRGVDKERRGFLRTQGVDAVIASSTHPFDIDPCRRIAREHGATLVWEVHDLWPLSPIELGGYSPRHPAIVLTQRAEDRCCRDADLVVSILPKANEHLRTRGMPDDRYVHISNGICSIESEQALSSTPLEEAAIIVEKAKVEGRTIVGYAGGHAPNHDLETLLDAASKIDPDRFCFILIGSGPSKKSLVQMVHKSGTRNVHFLDRTTRGRALATLSLTDAAYVGIAEGSLYRFGIGLNKIYDAMFVGRPIVAAYTAGNDPIGESACGFTSPAGDSDAVAAALVHLAAMNDDERNSMGLRGRKHVLNHHDYRHLSDRFLEAVQSSKSKGARSLPG